MAEMTLEKAESILAKARKSKSTVVRTDIQLLREMNHRYWTAAIASVFSAAAMLFSYGNHQLDIIQTMAIAIVLISNAAFMTSRGTRIVRIRELFENSGPQNLSQLKSGSNH